MLEKYEWISNEKQFFGQPNTAYDFAANDMKEVSRRLSKLQETKEKLGKNVNMRAMNMLGKAEEKVGYKVQWPVDSNVVVLGCEHTVWIVERAWEKPRSGASEPRGPAEWWRSHRFFVFSPVSLRCRCLSGSFDYPEKD